MTGVRHAWTFDDMFSASVGLRPCSGAIIVLIFALAQDLFWTSVGATLIMGLGTAVTVAAIATAAISARQIASRVAKSRAGLGILAMRAIEVGAAALIVAFGILLLAGYMASEQLWMFTGVAAMGNQLRTADEAC